MPEEITINSKVIIKLDNEIKAFRIVGSAEVDAAEGKISYLSPVGEALLGKKVGDVFDVKLTNNKVIKCELVKVIKY